MIGLLFSGQGAQKTGLTQDLYETVPTYRKVIDQAATILDFDLPSLLFDESQASKLASTRYCQPAILAISYGLYQLIEANLPEAKFGIGLSLGEYSALAASGHVDFATALRLIKRRGELMQQASDNTPSKMAAVMKADLADVQAACKEATSLGAVGVANVNTPQQIVIGGATTAVDQVISELTAAGKRVVPLKVSGAFHTPVMAPIQADLNAELRTVDWQAGTFPVYSTTTQMVFSPENLTANLTQQLVSTTYFAKTLSEHKADLTAVIEVGPGRTLISFARKLDRKLPTYRLDSSVELQKTIAALEAH
ncbi:ACP S-malonyltransferase [Lactobacillus sp. ESL0701]|uniref:ACP S-malonyltransferase n=1 Tax=Lactobacillus sp. ESL0701 TaxID=2983217 RepID=UPI0023F87D67|nr:ACP S-malonyltransferase [Lactobacillus sp. ESL0701]MDF7672805.1 ACP S-malonyltransferase [Lactobacillus sp. ESL0701]